MDFIDERREIRYNMCSIYERKEEKNMANPVVTFEMENGDIMKAELYPEIAPNTVKNFISLVNKGFYDGLIFHRVISGFMIQGGCPDGTGMGGPGYTIKGEFSQNGFANDLLHDEGVLSMARAMHPDSAGSQFFIMHKKSPHLDGAYAAFGRITEGMDVVNKIADTATDYNDKPLETQRMKKVTVETFGTEYEDVYKRQDVKTYKRGHPSYKPGISFGHEAAGIVHKKGSKVTGFEVGDRI